MGEQRVTVGDDGHSRRNFIRQLLRDMQALEYLLGHEAFESDITRIGAEQELFLIDRRTLKPAPVAMEVLSRLKAYPAIVTELARFNIEINLTPRAFTNTCLG